MYFQIIITVGLIPMVHSICACMKVTKHEHFCCPVHACQRGCDVRGAAACRWSKHPGRAHYDEEHTCREAVAGTERTRCPAPAAGLAAPSHQRNKQQGGGEAVFSYKRVLSDAPTHVLLKESYSYPVWHSQR